MRTSKLITVSAVALLLGATSLAIGQGGTAGQSASQRDYSQGSQQLQRGQGMTGTRNQSIAGARGQAERGQTIPGERGQDMSFERSRPTTGQRGQLQSGQSQTSGLAGARGSATGAEAGLSQQQRMQLGEMLSTRRNIPRTSSVNANIRVGAAVPKTVRTAPVPPEVARLHPRFRGDRVFMYRDEIVIVDPTTSRIIAVLPT